MKAKQINCCRKFTLFDTDSSQRVNKILLSYVTRFVCNPVVENRNNGFLTFYPADFKTFL